MVVEDSYASYSAKSIETFHPVPNLRRARIRFRGRFIGMAVVG